MSFVPPYPKSHANGHATVVQLDESLKFTSEKIDKLKQAMQYTLTGGRGKRRVNHIEFFEIEGNEETDIPMDASQRQCAGVKVYTI